MTTSKEDYQKGYNAGKRYADTERKKLTAEIARLKADRQKETKRERIFMRSLEIALQHGGDWSIGGKKIKDVEGYCKLAKFLTDNAIDIIK